MYNNCIAIAKKTIPLKSGLFLNPTNFIVYCEMGIISFQMKSK